MDVLDGRPDNGQTTGFCREHINLISALSYVTEKALNGIRALNVSMDTLRELVKRQEMLFVLRQATHRFRIALSILGECSQPIGSVLPACSVAPRFRPNRPGRPPVPVGG
jgi:hypothetical protein